ncbi:MAG: aryl-sulfate sulfotransferase [Bryobacteraceae bacterium]
MSVSLAPSPAQPSPAGAQVTWTAEASSPGATWYRFRVRRAEGEYRMIRDYGPVNTLEWAPLSEGSYEMEVWARNFDTGESAAASVTYEVAPRAAGAPVISATAHPMVWLYSAPACTAGGRIRVSLEGQDGATQYTPWQPCAAGLTFNQYLAGMRAAGTYRVRHEVDAGSGAVNGPYLNLRVPDVAIPVPDFKVAQPPQPPVPQGVLLQSVLFTNPLATDLNGNPVWFYPQPLTFLTRANPGGTFWGILEDFFSDPSGQVVREFDLAGNTVRETNAARINEQLAARGLRLIGSFHHEALSLPDGGVLVLASSEQAVEDLQGPGRVNVIGDTIIALDRDMQVVWVWDCFDHLDLSRTALLGETCTPGAGGCPPFYNSERANDWLHSNSLALTPDGNILISVRHLDQLLKVDYANGRGSGRVLWALGKGGDFTLRGAPEDAWFSHQHDANYISHSRIAVFDNGNMRQAEDENVHSRGQVWEIDERTRTAFPVLNADLGGYCLALGSAQRLPNGNYHYNCGWLPGNLSRSSEVSPSGATAYSIDFAILSYRTVRMRDMYTPE